MPRLQRKSFTKPDQVRAFPSGRMDVVMLDDTAIGRFALRPGWRWSKDVAPVVRTRPCQNRHIGYAVSGSIQVTMDDDTQLVMAKNDERPPRRLHHRRRPTLPLTRRFVPRCGDPARST